MCQSKKTCMCGHVVQLDPIERRGDINFHSSSWLRSSLPNKQLREKMYFLIPPTGQNSKNKFPHISANSKKNT